MFFENFVFFRISAPSKTVSILPQKCDTPARQSVYRAGAVYRISSPPALTLSSSTLASRVSGYFAGRGGLGVVIFARSLEHHYCMNSATAGGNMCAVKAGIRVGLCGVAFVTL